MPTSDVEALRDLHGSRPDVRLHLPMSLFQMLNGAMTIVTVRSLDFDAPQLQHVA